MGLLRAAAARNIAVILATHDLIAARRFADRAVALNAQGAVAAQGLAADVLSPPTLARLFNVPFDEAATPHGAAPVPFAPTLPRR
jgi:ABC-type hemin transport system ATPase subunit